MVSYKAIVTNKNFNKLNKGSPFNNELNLFVLHQEEIIFAQKEFDFTSEILIFMHIPKTGGTYFDLALCQSSAKIYLPKITYLFNQSDLFMKNNSDFDENFPKQKLCIQIGESYDCRSEHGYFWLITWFGTQFLILIFLYYSNNFILFQI